MTFLMSLARAAKRSVPMVSSTLKAAGLAGVGGGRGRGGWREGEEGGGVVLACSTRS